MKLPRFRRRDREIKAVQIGQDGYVQLGRRQLVGDAGHWVVIDARGKQTVLTNPEFRATFEPVDEEAEQYLKRAVQS
jgi:hypothetical protein